MDPVRRRRFLGGIGVGSAIGLAGCSGLIGDNGDDREDTDSRDRDDFDDDPKAVFEVANLEPVDVELVREETLTVTARVTNAGDEHGAGVVTYRVDGKVLAERPIALPAGASTDLTVEDVDPGIDEPGEYDHGVFTEDDQATGILSILPGAAFVRNTLDVNGMGDAKPNTPPHVPRLKTYDGDQYVAYWGHDGQLVVASRALPDGDWTTHELGIEIANRNGHWAPALGIGPEGHVFICYNTRNSEIRWRRSEDPQEVRSFGPEQVGMTGQMESSATYVEFTRLQDGTLLEAHRDGASGAGNWTMNRWDPAVEEWEALHHPLIEGNGFNSYMWNLTQSGESTLHYFFNWRETGDVATNVDLSYARSPDGGKTWERSDGTPYDLPITPETAEVVDPIGYDSNFINQGWASAHPVTHEPHVTYFRDDEHDRTQIFHASLDDGAWTIERTTNRATAMNLGGGGTVGSSIGRMGIVVDDHGTVYILARDYEAGGWPLLIEDRDGEWQTHVLYRHNLSWSDIHIDQQRWRADRVLSFIDQGCNINAAPWSANTVIGITDVDPAILDRTHRTIDLGSEAQGRPVPWLRADLASVTTDAETFTNTAVSLPITETALPATPAAVRLSGVSLDAGDGAEAEARIAIEAADGTTTGAVVSSTDDQPVTTDWIELSEAFRRGTATVQLRVDSDATAEITAGHLEVGAYDPTATADEVPSSELPAHVEPVETAVLGADAPLTNAVGTYKDTPLTVDVPETDDRLLARLVAELAHTTVDDAEWVDYTLESTFKIESDHGGFLIRARDPDNFYLFNVKIWTDPNEMTILPFVDGDPIFDEAEDFDVSDAIPEEESDDWHDMQIDASGDGFEVTINDVHVASYTHETHDTGKIGFRTGSDAAIWIDDVQVVDPDGDVLFETSFDDTDESELVDDGVLKIPQSTLHLWPAVDETGAARLNVEDPEGETSFSHPMVIDSADPVIRETGWTSVPEDAAGGTVRLELAETTITSAVLEIGRLT